MVQLEDWASRPPPTGFLRLHGHFSGTITTATHCLEVALPLQCDLPLRLAETVLEAFRHQEGEEEEKRRKEKPQLAEIWRQLGLVLQEGTDRQQGNSGPERCSEGLQPGATVADLESRSRAGSGLRSQGQLARQEHYDESLEVDVLAKEELVRQLQQERDELLEQNHELREESKVGGLSRWLDHLRQGSALASHIARSEEENAPDQDHRPAKLEEGDMFLEGTFLGRATTQKHLLDVNLPFKGTFSGARALQVFNTIAQKNGEVPTAKEEESKGLQMLARIFEDEYGGRAEDNAGEALQDRPGPPVGTVGAGGAVTNAADVARMAELSATLQSRDDQLRITMQELDALRGEHLRVQCEEAHAQCEAETLRARSTALAGDLADAEASAQQLRDELQAQQRAQLQEQQQNAAWRQGGSRPIAPLGPASRATQEAAKEHKALVHDLKELECWAKEVFSM